MINELRTLRENNVSVEIYRGALVDIENYILSISPDGVKDLPIKHYFCNGLYAREMFIPKGTVLTGAIHKTQHLCVLSGDIEIESEFSAGRFTGYHMFVSEPGAKRIGFAYEDTYFTTLHPTDLTDPELLERILTSKTYEDYNNFLLDVARWDYNNFLTEFGLSEEMIQPFVQNESDQIPMPEDYTGLELKESPIHGTGLFATKIFKQGDLVCPARLGLYRTPGGRYINHSHLPNVVFKLCDDNLWVYASKDIDIGEELTLNYRQAGNENDIKNKLGVSE